MFICLLKFYTLKLFDLAKTYTTREYLHTVEKVQDIVLKIICRVYKGIDHLFVQKVATIFNTFSMELQRSVIMSLSFFEQAIFSNQGIICDQSKNPLIVI